MHILRILKWTSTLTLLAAAAAGTEKRPMEIADLFKIQRIAEPALSPDGRSIAYSVTICDLNHNRTRSSLWVVHTDGTHAEQLTTAQASDKKPAWSPDGRWIAFESTRSGGPQIWLIASTGGEPRRFTWLSTGATEPVWSPDGTSIAFVSEVFPEYSRMPFREADSLNGLRLKRMKDGPVKAKIFTELLFRHWDKWVDGKREHIFIQPSAGGEPRDLTPGDRDAVPTSTTFSAGIDFAFSPDGREIAYTATPVPTREEAWSTNHDIYTVDVNGGSPKQITTNPAADGYPRYSPDGRYIAYRAQATPGFEADRWQLMLYDRAGGTVRSLTGDFDASVGSPAWSPDSRSLYFQSEERGSVPIFAVSVAGNDVRKIVEGGTNRNINVSPDGKELVFTRTTFVQPVELYRADADRRQLRRVTTANDSLLSKIELPSPQSVWFDGAEGTRVQAWLFEPPHFAATKRYPFVYLVHGGPQNAWLDAWSYRWNPVLWAAQGYIIMAPNPRGSTGFGQKFTNEISRDWGGKVFVDLMKGLDYAVSLPFVDSTDKAAAGASFGGYMMNWFQGHAGGRFRTIVTHDGVYNFESMYGTTEEVWFDEWDHGGPPWVHPEQFLEYSPHLAAGSFRTPNLIIHSEQDYRVPLSEGLQLFTALQRQGVPSKLLYFPDEGHLVLKPGNSELWHKTVFDWLAEYLHPGNER